MAGVVGGWLWELFSLARAEVTLGAVCVYSAIVLLSWLVSKLFIFPVLSPLSKIPGRPLTLGSILLGQLPEIMRKEAIDPYYDWMIEMKTGIVRYRHVLGAQRVMVANADAVKEVLVTSSADFPRPTFLLGFFHRVVGERGLLTLEGREHSIQRRLCNSAFKQSSVLGLLPTFQKHTEQLCQHWTSAIKGDKEGPTLVDVQTHLSNMTFDIICDAGFGYKSNALQDPNEKISAAFNYVMGGGGNRLMRIVIPRLYSMLPTEHNRKTTSSLSFIHSLIRKVIGKKRETIQEKETEVARGMDLLEVLVRAVDVETGAGLPAGQLQDHVMTFMLAGHETTASSMTWILHMLAAHPDVQTKARQEVMSHLPRQGRPISAQDLEQLPYVACVVKETLRLYPPAPVVLREAAKDTKLCGHDIPKGTVVTVSIGALHRNPEYWEDPESFRPERFADESGVNLNAYQPFISGPHMCIGHKFAMHELKVTLALLLLHFEFSPLPDVTYRKKQMITMRPFPPLKLYVRCVA